jgi:hypothetical protein
VARDITDDEVAELVAKIDGGSKAYKVFEQLAIHYRSRKQFAEEVALLERALATLADDSPARPRCVARLEAAQAKLERAGADAARADVRAAKDAERNAPKVGDRHPEMVKLNRWLDKMQARGNAPGFVNTHAAEHFTEDVEYVTNMQVAFGLPYAAAIKRFVKGSQQRVELVDEQGNPHDEYAVAVHGHYVTSKGEPREDKLGYAPRRQVERFGELWSAGAQLEVLWLTATVDTENEDVDIDFAVLKSPRGTRDLRTVDYAGPKAAGPTAVKTASSGGCLALATVIVLALVGVTALLAWLGVS